MGVFLLLAFCALMYAVGEANREETLTARFFAMDTVMELTVTGTRAQEVLELSREEIGRLEGLLSVTDENSEIAALNREGGGAVSQEVYALLEDAQGYARATGGAFDVTIAPVVKAWGFTEAEHSIPEEETLRQLLELTGPEAMRLADGKMWMKEGAQIDLGGIAKGYAADQLAALWEENEIDSGILSLGGNVYAKGKKEDGGDWKVAIRDPKEPSSYMGTVPLSDAYAVTSGGYQRYFERDGKRYHHIIDPSTGAPADSGLLSVTVVAKRGASGDPFGWDGALCDALSTALFVMGEEKAVEFWRDGPYRFEFLLVTEDGRAVLSEGLEGSFEKSAGAAYRYEVVRGI